VLRELALRRGIAPPSREFLFSIIVSRVDPQSGTDLGNRQVANYKIKSGDLTGDMKTRSQYVFEGASQPLAPFDFKAKSEIKKYFPVGKGV